ncbi:hypothetical protein AB0M87_33260 [Streptomyces sp. NPDC051320]|uniref:hypothetical protein n=1 Tax=Streptomyces sp. NPDC051320 TaxID=3154644 RepID=UPI0034479B8C
MRSGIPLTQRLVDEMAGRAAGPDRSGTRPAFLSEQEAIDTALGRYADDAGCDLDTILAARRYTLTSDPRALEDTWL